ncbi:MAG: Na(+)/H(+) antiporter subunit D [Alphaproteobacteria bacterium]|nr:Na(+)/H(+) antiporter subunit D [Alphaproteobacteria bacterium]
MLGLLPPGLILIAAAALLPFTSGRLRDTVLLAAPLLAIAQVMALPAGASLTLDWLGEELVPLRVDAISRLFGLIFSIMGFLGALFALRQQRLAELVAAFLYAGSAIGVAFAGDLLTVFVYWELMAVASALIVWSGGMAGSFGAAMRYIFVHFLGGVLLMAGIIWHIVEGGGTGFGLIGLAHPSGWLILAGFLINAGAWPLSSWVGDAYPEASYSGTVFLSAFTTKTAVYVLWRAFPGTELLIVVGLIMVFYGIIYALLENDMRRILAYSIVNQVGFMVTGIGIGTEMALNGAASHAFAHIIYKALLLMAAGSVLLQTGRRRCSELGGLFQSMPVTTLCAIVGALAISAFPLTSGFVSKSMISDAAAHEHLGLAWFLLTAASAGVFLHAGIKFPWFVFFQKDSGLRPPDPPWHMKAAMILAAILCVGIGVYPAPLYALLPFEVEFAPYTAEHVIEMLELLLFAGLAFFVLLPLMKRTRTISLDTDFLWRRVGPALWRLGLALLTAAGALGGRLLTSAGRLGSSVSGRVVGPQGLFALTLETGLTILVLTIALAAALWFTLGPDLMAAMGGG